MNLYIISNGVKTVFSVECPPGFTKKKIIRSPETRQKMAAAQARRYARRRALE